MLDTGGPLTEAIALCRPLGFGEAPPRHGADPEPDLLFFARDL